MAANVTKESASLAAAWSISTKLLGGLATRYSEIADNCTPLFAVVDARLSKEPRDAMLVNEAAIRQVVQAILDDPRRFESHALNRFAAYKSTDSPRGDSVPHELRKLHQLLDLCLPLIDERWPRIKCWLLGTRESDVTKFLSRTCEGVSP